MAPAQAAAWPEDVAHLARAPFMDPPPLMLPRVICQATRWF